MNVDSLDSGNRISAIERSSGGANAEEPQMVAVAAGWFVMGSPASEPQREFQMKGTETPQHKVTIGQSLAVARHPVTRGEFSTFVNTTGYIIASGMHIWTGVEWKLDLNASWRNPGFQQGDDHPVVCVNWDDAKAYAAWLAEITGKPYRLLTEAEREYVARAETTTPFWWGSSITPAQANYNGAAEPYEGGGVKGEWRKGTVPVSSFQPNPWGLFNVHGNVWEWCEDVWHDSYEGAPSNESAWSKGGEPHRRVVRGGSWDNKPRYLRSANRYGIASGFRLRIVGFRLARKIDF